MPRPNPKDPVLAALDELETVLRQATERNRVTMRRAEAIRRLRKRGHRYGEIVPMEKRPLIVELLTRSLYELSNVSSRLRKVEARALYSEGLTMAEIADLFGVTRQRVAALLRSDKHDERPMSRTRRPRNLGGFLVFGLVEAVVESLIPFKRVFDWSIPF